MEARGRFLPRSQIRQNQHNLRDKLHAPSLCAGMPPLAPPQPMRQRPASGKTARDALAMPREGLSALLKTAGSGFLFRLAASSDPLSSGVEIWRRGKSAGVPNQIERRLQQRRCRNGKVFDNLGQHKDVPIDDADRHWIFRSRRSPVPRR